MADPVLGAILGAQFSARNSQRAILGAQSSERNPRRANFGAQSSARNSHLGVTYSKRRGRQFFAQLELNGQHVKIGIGGYATAVDAAVAFAQYVSEKQIERCGDARRRLLPGLLERHVERLDLSLQNVDVGLLAREPRLEARDRGTRAKSKARDPRLARRCSDRQRPRNAGWRATRPWFSNLNNCRGKRRGGSLAAEQGNLNL